MKASILAAALGITLAGISGTATAGCSTDRVNDLNALLSGNTVCVPVATTANMQWQELHQAGGDLIDYKRGPSSTIDKSEKVGTWSISSDVNGGYFVVHNYGAGGLFTWAVYDNKNGTHSFCGPSGAPEVVARVKPGGGAC